MHTAEGLAEPHRLECGRGFAGGGLGKKPMRTLTVFGLCWRAEEVKCTWMVALTGPAVVVGGGHESPTAGADATGGVGLERDARFVTTVL